ncbi:hypothetical protein [Arthrobacter agilis]
MWRRPPGSVFWTHSGSPTTGRPASAMPWRRRPPP